MALRKVLELIAVGATSTRREGIHLQRRARCAVGLGTDSSLYAHLPSLSPAAIEGPLTSHVRRLRAEPARMRPLRSPGGPDNRWRARAGVRAASLLEARLSPYNVTWPL